MNKKQIIIAKVIKKLAQEFIKEFQQLLKANPTSQVTFNAFIQSLGDKGLQLLPWLLSELNMGKNKIIMSKSGYLLPLIEGLDNGKRLILDHIPNEDRRKILGLTF